MLGQFYLGTSYIDPDGIKTKNIAKQIYLKYISYV